MKINGMTIVKSLILVGLTAALIYGYSGGGPLITGYAGCFGDLNCTECHNEFPLNSGPGTFTLTAEPLDSGQTIFTEGYVANHPYTLVVILQQTGQVRWGFEMIARFEANSRQAGHFEPVSDPPMSGYTQVAVFQSPTLGPLEYITHTLAGTRFPTPDGPVPFAFKWTAPALADIPPDNPRIVFCGVGNAADGSFSPDGDYIYSTSRTVSPNPDWFPSDDDEGDPMPEDSGGGIN